MPTAIVTGSGGLIGSESVAHFVDAGYDVIGLENDMRAEFFGAGASTRAVTERLREQLSDEFRSLDVDIRDADGVDRVCSRSTRRDLELVDPHRRAAVARLGGLAIRRPTSASTRTARSTCSRRRASTRPTRRSSSRSTNKVYGDRPNSLPLVELETRLELPEDHPYYGGIDTSMSIDASHALAVRRLEGGGRPARAGVRPLLRHADGLLPRRLPDRPEPRRRRSCTASSRT